MIDISTKECISHKKEIKKDDEDTSDFEEEEWTGMCKDAQTLIKYLVDSDKKSKSI